MIRSREPAASRVHSASASPQVPGVLIQSDTSLDEYLASARGLAHLFDLAPQHQPGFTGTAADVAPLAAIVRARAGRQTDLRLLIDDGMHHHDLAVALADNLRCDVYLTPKAADIRFVKESSAVTGESWDAIAVDRESTEPVEWRVVRPTDLPPGVPTWFVSSRGRLRPSSGLVNLPLPTGIAFPTKATFRDTAQLMTHMQAGTSRVTTLAVNADLGRFEICRFDDASALLGGVEFATLVAASLDVIHPDVQIALTWPTTADGCTTLDAELARVADGLNRTVWVPAPAGAAFVVPGLGEFTAVDEVGAPGSWRPYPADASPDWQPHYRTDLDGRLAPIGDVIMTAFPGAPLVCVPAAQLDELREWYESVAPCPDLFAIDLAVLTDGWLGVCLQDGKSFAVGPRELRRLLIDAGWAGEDLLLLAQPSAEYWEAMATHARFLIESLTVDIWLAAPGAEVWVRPDGTLDAEGPDGAELAWRVLRYGLPDADASSVTLPPALAGLLTPAWPSRSEPELDEAPLGPPDIQPAFTQTADPPPADARTVDAQPVDTRPADAQGVGTHPVDTAPTGVAPAGGEPTPSTPPLATPTPPAGPVPDAPGLLPPALTPAPTLPIAAATAGTAASAGTATAGAVTDAVATAGAAVAGTVASATVAGTVATAGVPVVSATRPGASLAQVGPASEPPARANRAHAVPWLPPTPAVNARPIELYLRAARTDETADGWGLPSPDLFLLASQDPLRLADRSRTGALLRVQVRPQIAVDLAEHAAELPESVRRRVSGSDYSHLLPLAWLGGGVWVTQTFDVDEDGGIRAGRPTETSALAVRFEGAAHGVTGLPNDVVHWPDRRLRTDAPTYVVLHDDLMGPNELVLIERGYLPLCRRRPGVDDGQRLLEVKIRRRSAIDVPATVEKLAGLPVVGQLQDFAGLDLILAEQEFGTTVVTKVRRPGGGRRSLVDKLTGATLIDALTAEGQRAGIA